MVALPILLIVAAIRSICRGQERGLRKLLLYRLFSWNRQDKSEEFFSLADFMNKVVMHTSVSVYGEFYGATV